MSPQARAELLAVPWCGVRVARRLGAIGVTSLADLRGRDPYELMEAVNAAAARPIWRPPMAILALSNLIAAADGRVPSAGAGEG
jgi:hypothetical protein